MKSVLYVGMDVHKETITLACACAGEEIRVIGKIANNAASLDAMVRKLISGGKHPSFVYEAGCSGYVICRHLRELGFDCMVAAPSLIPRKSGDRVKTDRRDAVMLTRLYRAGELTGIAVPEADDEAMRDLYRARMDAKKMSKIAKQQLLGLLLRLGYCLSSWQNTLDQDALPMAG